MPRKTRKLEIKEANLREDIGEIFPEAVVESCYISLGGKKKWAEVHLFGENLNDVVTFDRLKKLSDLLGTKMISLREVGESGGCPSCGHGASKRASIRIEDIKTD